MGTTTFSLDMGMVSRNHPYDAMNREMRQKKYICAGPSINTVDFLTRFNPRADPRSLQSATFIVRY